LTIDSGNERRKFARAKLSVPVEFRAEGQEVASRAATSDLSRGGFYLETMFTMPVGMELEVTLHLESPVLAIATVATCDPSFGNGIRFIKMLPEDEEVLQRYLEAQEQAASPPDDPSNGAVEP
jgi:c-di-GMP-binding flagellar brake protein YcgR